MSARARKKLSPSRFIAPLATLMILGYFGFHATNGQYGTRAHISMKTQIIQLEQELAKRTKIRNTIEARVALLRKGSLERDMVDEQIRRQLNMVRPNEIVLIYPK